MDCERENFTLFVPLNEDSETNSNLEQTDIPVVSLHQSLLRQHHLSLNQQKDHLLPSQPDKPGGEKEEVDGKARGGVEDTQMLVSDLTVPRLQPHQFSTVGGGGVHHETCACQLCSSQNDILPRTQQAAQVRPTSWTCSLCPLKYKRPADLNRHMKRKHGMSLMKNDKNVLVPIVASPQQHKSDNNNNNNHSHSHHDLQPLNLSLKCALSDASIESAESQESETMTLAEDQPLDLSANKNSPIDYRQKTLNKNSEHSNESDIYPSTKKVSSIGGNFDAFKVVISAGVSANPLHYGRPSISAPAIRYRPFKCSECGRRSNWRWDLNKHIRTSNHPHAHLIELSEHVARATFHEVLKKENSPYLDPLLTNIQNLQPDSSVVTGGDSTSPGLQANFKPYLCTACGYRSSWKCDMAKHVKLSHDSAGITLLTEDVARETLQSYERHQGKDQSGAEQMELESNPSKSIESMHSSGCTMTQEHGNYHVVKCNSAESNFNFSSSHTVDARKTKKFKCSACPYRSNFRSDVGRHIRHKHDRATCRIVVMSDAEAASTLGEYMDTWARKKFVPSPNKRRCLVPLACLQPDETYSSLLQVYESPFVVSSTTSTTEQLGTGVPSTSTMPTQESSSEGQGKSLKSKRWWKCSSCDYRDQSKDIIVQHWHYKHNNAPITVGEEAFSTCETGDSENSSLLELFQARQTLEDSKAVKEQLPCESRTPSEAKSNAVVEVKQFSCSTCPYKACTQELLDIHKSYHTAKEGNNFSCTFCPYFVCAAPLLSQHLALHVEELKSAKRPGMDPRPIGEQILTINSGTDFKPSEDSNSPMNLSSISSHHPCETEKSHDKVSVFLMTNAVRSGGRTTYLCSQCPYVSCNRNDYLYHRQFHRPRPTAFKCPHCPYWVSQKRLLSQHYKVHELDYQQKHRSKELPEVRAKHKDDNCTPDGVCSNNIESIAKQASSSNRSEMDTANAMHGHEEKFTEASQIAKESSSINESEIASPNSTVMVGCDVRRENFKEKGVFLEKLGLIAS